MRLRRRIEATATATGESEPATFIAWGDIPATPAHEPLIKAPRAGDAVAAAAPAQAA